jgi:hypothetical protein
MCRRLFVAVTTLTVALAVPAGVLAAGAPIRKPPTTVGASPASTPGASSIPSVEQGTSHVQPLGGCGKGRVRDPRTNQCRGPADIGR